jgi:hypothetical protein
MGVAIPTTCVQAEPSRHGLPHGVWTKVDGMAWQRGSGLARLRHQEGAATSYRPYGQGEAAERDSGD